uniref:phage baseplate protein n=1 Tax=Anaerostipes caccae TaxID=105841 RepID=UPI003AB7197E
MILPVFLENTNLEEGYDLWQVGIYAQDPEEGEILYCIAHISAAKHIPSASKSPGFSITWDFCFKSSNTSPFEVNIDSVGLVNIEQFQIHTGEISHLKSSIVSLDERIEDLNSALYPVGIVLAFLNGFDPNKSLLGEWEPIAKGQTLVGVNESDPDFNSVEKSGGLKDVTLSIKQIPAHSHPESDLCYVYTDEHPANNSIVTTNQNGRQNINMNIKSKTYTKNAGEGGAHSNLQPYITVFYWVRRK